MQHFSIGSCYKTPGSCLTNALLEFHAFTGCYQTGHFMGMFWWENIMNADDNKN